MGLPRLAPRAYLRDMRFISTLAFVMLLSLPVTSVTAQEAIANPFWPGLIKPEQTDATSSKIIDLHLKARGGRKAIEALRSIRFQGRLFEGRKDFKIEAIHIPSGAAHFEIFYDHMGDEYRTVKASDGKVAWQRKVLPEKERPSIITGEEGKLLDLDARLPFLFLDHTGQGHVFTYTGEKEFLGRPAYVIHGWLSSGLQVDILFDKESFQILNYRHLFKIGGKEVLVNLTPSKLKRLENVWWETEHKMNYRGKTFRRITCERMKANVPVEDSLFAQPEIREIWLRGSRK